jgi:hypothetical protein
MQDYEARNRKLRALADTMWGACDGTTVTQNRYGKGHVVWGLTPQQWLGQALIEPDFVCLEESADLDYIHRRTRDVDIYFVRNKSDNPVNAWCQFRVAGPAPQLWDPTDGSIKPAYVYETVDSTTRVQLDLAQGATTFVVFDRNARSDRVDSPAFECFENRQYTVTDNEGHKKDVRVDSLPEPLTLEGPWTVAFDPDWGAPAQIELPELMSWTDHDNEGVKYYSGAGVYTKTLNVPREWLASGRRVHLDLGEVRDVAEVYVNGKSAGVLWKAPLMVDITTLVKPGNNALKIDVVNMWINRLIGDESLPAEKKFTRTNIRSFDSSRAKPGTVTFIQPAGLLGPVRLVPSVQVRLEHE